MGSIYNENFYKNQQNGSMVSAINVIPYLLKIIQPKSVIDIGCGVGTWLNVFKNKFYIKKVLGVDGEYVDKKMLLIDNNEFVSYNLESIYTAPTKFDLAICMEVGEHLADKYSDNLVQSLTGSSDFIMFSAAIPGQIGTYHINEQWPEYWARKFIAKGFVCVDYIRKEIWDIKEIDLWYRQNAILFIEKEAYEKTYKTKLEVYKEKTDPEFLTRIHPDLMLHYLEKFRQTRTYVGFIRYQLFPLKKLFLRAKKK